MVSLAWNTVFDPPIKALDDVYLTYIVGGSPAVVDGTEFTTIACTFEFAPIIVSLIKDEILVSEVFAPKDAVNFTNL